MGTNLATCSARSLKPGGLINRMVTDRTGREIPVNCERILFI